VHANLTFFHHTASHSAPYLACTASRCQRTYILPLWFIFSSFFLSFLRCVIFEFAEWISTKLGHIFTYECYLKNFVRTPPVIYLHGLGAKKTLFWDRLWTLTEHFQRNMISTIGKTSYMPSNLVNFGLKTVENDWQVFAHHPKFLHWEPLPALPHGRYITDSRLTLARVI